MFSAEEAAAVPSTLAVVAHCLREREAVMAGLPDLSRTSLDQAAMASPAPRLHRRFASLDAPVLAV